MQVSDRTGMDKRSYGNARKMTKAEVSGDG